MALNHSPLALRAALRTREVRVGIGVVLVFALALTGLYAVRTSHASGYTVCGTGCTYTSINAAITAASPGATITVGPGTYGPNSSDNPIVITKALTLQGAGVGQSIINDVTAYQASAANSGMVQVTNPGGNVTISGFTMTGAIANDAASCCDDGHFIFAADNNAADTMTFSGNLFYEDQLLDPQLLGDQLDAIVVDHTVATTNITNNTFQGIFRAALFSEGGGDGPVNFSHNDLNGLHGLYDITTTPPTLYNWPEGLFFLSDNTTNQTATHLVSGNTFENYDGMAIGFDAGYPGNLIGAISNFTITGNTFNVGGVTGVNNGVSEVMNLHAFGYTNGTVTSTISNMTIQNNVFNEASGTGNGYGIDIKGDVTTGINISNNAFHGSGANPPLAGVHIFCDENTGLYPTPCSATTPPGVSLTNNFITGYQHGLDSDTLPTGTSVAASQNCIFGNTTDGAFSSDSGNTGAQINAQQNWWGAAGGPNTPGADKVAGNISTSGFLTAAASVCQGPVGSAITTTPAHVLVGNSFTLSASMSDASTGGFSIASAQYSRDGGSYSAMNAQDGTFDTENETVTTTVPGIATPGVHTFCVRGSDSQGNQGTAFCAPITVYTPDTVGLRATSTTSDYFRNSNTTGIANRVVAFGTAGDTPLAGDWTGKGYDSVGTYHSATSTFSLRNTNTSGPADTTILFGVPGDIPVVGDWDGNGTDTIGVYRPSNNTFYLRNSNSAGPADVVATFGGSGDIPLVGDWTGKGYDSVGVYRTSTHQFFLRNTNTTGMADIALTYGGAGDTPIVGDWTDQGKTTIGIYRASNSTFYLRNTNTTGVSDITFVFNPTASVTPFIGRWTTAGPYIAPHGGNRPASGGNKPHLNKGGV